MITENDGELLYVLQDRDTIKCGNKISSEYTREQQHKKGMKAIVGEKKFFNWSLDIRYIFIFVKDNIGTTNFQFTGTSRI